VDGFDLRRQARGFGLERREARVEGLQLDQGQQQ